MDVKTDGNDRDLDPQQHWQCPPLSTRGVGVHIGRFSFSMKALAGPRFAVICVSQWLARALTLQNYVSVMHRPVGGCARAGPAAQDSVAELPEGLLRPFTFRKWCCTLKVGRRSYLT